MRIYVKPMPMGRRTAFNVRASDMIHNVKELIAAHPSTRIMVNEQSLKFAGMQLEDNRTIPFYNIEHGDIIKYQAM